MIINQIESLHVLFIGKYLHKIKKKSIKIVQKTIKIVPFLKSDISIKYNHTRNAGETI